MTCLLEILMWFNDKTIIKKKLIWHTYSHENFTLALIVKKVADPLFTGSCVKVNLECASLLLLCVGEQVQRVMRVSRDFFLQPDEEKRPFSRKTFANNPNHGWVSLEAERWDSLQGGQTSHLLHHAVFVLTDPTAFQVESPSTWGPEGGIQYILTPP